MTHPTAPSPASPQCDASEARVAQARAGSVADEAAALGPMLRAVVAKMLSAHPTDADVEDCTHEALRRALEGKDRLRAGEPLRPWVVGIAKHVALDALRAKKRQRDRSAAPPQEDDEGREGTAAVERVADEAPSAFDRFADAERARAVREAMAGLPDGAREALSLFHLEGLGYGQISERLGVPLGTVATWVTRGRKSLQTAFAQQENRT